MSRPLLRVATRRTLDRLPSSADQIGVVGRPNPLKGPRKAMLTLYQRLTEMDSAAKEIING
jgi:hypothetical protein